jgi:transcriptional regulator with XRE-family HTH domain
MTTKTTGIYAEIRMMRHASNMTQGEVCAVLGWSKSKFSKIESSCQTPTYQELIDIAKVCGYEAKFFFSRVEAKA